MTEEKQILREIKQLESTREKVVANDAMRAKIQDSMVQKEVLQDQVKVRDFEFCFFQVFLAGSVLPFSFSLVYWKPFVYMIYEVIIF